jgi:hypothetical protein
LGEEAAELQGPTTDCLVADVDAALGQHFLDIAKAEGEPEVEPNGLSIPKTSYAGFATQNRIAA